MAEFSASVFQNEFLSDGATDVHAIVTVTASGTGAAGSDGAAAEIIIVDCSGSMTGENMTAAKRAAAVAVDQIIDGTFFAVVAGSERADRAFPYPNASVSMVRMEPGARAAAKEAIGFLQADGGTAMGSWLTLARQLFATVPEATQRHAILSSMRRSGRPGASSSATCAGSAPGGSWRRRAPSRARCSARSG
jgi:hypothetical protein